MRKLLAIIMFCFLLVAIGYGEVRREPISKMQIRENLAYIDNEQNPYTGVIFAHYPNDQLKSEETFRVGKQDGIFKEWYENGQLKVELTFKDGKLGGGVKQWHENGQLKVEATYKDSKQDGVVKEWYENGQGISTPDSRTKTLMSQGSG